MLDGFTQFSQYMPHGMCLLWQPWLVVLWAGSDLLIFLSYMAIPFALLTVMRKREDIPFGRLVVLFAGFILLCGFTHLLGIVTLWYPIYPWVGVVKLATGLVSFVTAIALFKLIPVLVSIPSPGDLAEANARLKSEIDAHRETLASLERQVQERTAELSKANAQLAVQTREAVHRSSNLLAVVSSLAQLSARDVGNIEQYVDRLLGRIRALATATATVMRGADRSSGTISDVVREQLEPLLEDLGDRLTVDGPQLEIGSEAAQQLGLALHELATNARKYGAASETPGMIALSWEQAQIDGEPALAFEWQESGIACVPPEDRADGFGTKLLVRVVPTMLKGRADRRFEGETFTYRLLVPMNMIAAGKSKSAGESTAAEIVDRNFGLA